MRLQKFLSRSGVVSRREAERRIVQGRVTVNGRIVAELGTRLDPSVDQVRLDGVVVSLPSVRWVLFNKPAGLLTTEHDPHGGRTIYERLPSELRGLRYVGRLDRDTTGLLLLTNDGDVANRLLHPRFRVEREYEADVSGQPGPEALRRLERGVELEDGPARAIRAEKIERSRVRIVLSEGRKREVRRMLEAIGHPVRRLERTRYGPLELGGLKRGDWRDLTRDEVLALERATSASD